MPTVKNRAKYHKKLSSKSLVQIRDESNEDQTKPKARQL